MTTFVQEENSVLLPSSSSAHPSNSAVGNKSSAPQKRRFLFAGTAFSGVVLFLISLLGSSFNNKHEIYTYDDLPIEVPMSYFDLPFEGLEETIHYVRFWEAPKPESRCDWVTHVFEERATASAIPRKELSQEYAVQSQDYNVFFRATAELFWLDFAGGKWANFSIADLGIDPNMDGVPFSETSLFTWITGDQHLSNFGAWRNRGGDIVFSVNDFDEAAIYDFHIDVLRIAVSVYNHAFMNGFRPHAIRNIVYAFLGTYVSTVISYVGNDAALVYEITEKNARGTLKEYLKSVATYNSGDKQLEKFTDVDESGRRRLIKNNRTRLLEVDKDLEDKIRHAFTGERYGATMMKMGFRVREWNDDYYRVVDVGRRVGSGVGSYGVDRFYVLLNGNNERDEGSAIILDVKYEPYGAVSKVLSPNDAAWYKVMFPHPAARAVIAQRFLTSFTDPFTGWVMIDGRAFVVRQRSPWKSAPDLNALIDKEDFTVFTEQIAIATATSHVRGSVSKSPAQFKHMLSAALDEYRHRHNWMKAITRLAMNYHEQVLLDFECFKRYVAEKYPPQ